MEVGTLMVGLDMAVLIQALPGPQVAAMVAVAAVAGTEVPQHPDAVQVLVQGDRATSEE